MRDLTTIRELSHEFGSAEYVKGGGGNTSLKNETTLWVKPSGTTLSGLSESDFVPMSRAKIDHLFSVVPPDEAAAREELVKNMMAAAVEAGTGRPSVEAPLHNLFKARFVVHTHPALVNGMTCAQDGKAACERLFPEALWLEYIDPGYTLSMVALERIGQYRREKGREPEWLFLQNHGIFIASDCADSIRSLYAHVMDRLRDAYAREGVSIELKVSDTAPSPSTVSTIQRLFGPDAASVVPGGMFAYPAGPLTPDHMVYARAFPFTAALVREEAEAYRARHGFAPKVVVAGDCVYGLGASPQKAQLALDLAADGALVTQLTGAFGGVHHMTDRQRAFIENWEVEAYRAGQT